MNIKDMKRLMTMTALALALAACGDGKGGNAAPAADGEAPVLVKAAGSLEVYWLKDNEGGRLMPASLFPDAPEALIDSLGVQDGIPSSTGAFLARTADGDILFDTGNGGPEGHLTDRLDSLGLAPADIDYIYITHFHGDHIGGMMEGDSAVFTNAQVYVPKAEYDAWMAMPADRKSQVVRTMDAYRDRLHMVDPRLELLAGSDVVLPGGVVPYHAPGHTPGHTVYYLGQAGLMIVGDLMHGAALQLEHPEINANFDMDGAVAAATRAKVLDCVRTNGLVMAGMHLPAPGYIDFAAEPAD